MEHGNTYSDRPYTFEIPTYSDGRGSLSVVEKDKQLPFDVKRVYYLYDVPSEASRGHHAHRELEQVIIAVHGSVTVSLKTESGTESFELDSPNKGLYVPQLTWRELDSFTENAVCLVLASMKYDEGDYINSYSEFRKTISENSM